MLLFVLLPLPMGLTSPLLELHESQVLVGLGCPAGKLHFTQFTWGPKGLAAAFTSSTLLGAHVVAGEVIQKRVQRQATQNHVINQSRGGGPLSCRCGLQGRTFSWFGIRSSCCCKK